MASMPRPAGKWQRDSSIAAPEDVSLRPRQDAPESTANVVATARGKIRFLTRARRR